ncbi:MAG: tripartite tricarboxylate transporter TctB family protein [Pseudomonadota bacterium]
MFLLLSGGYGYFAGQIPLDFWSEQEPFNARSMPTFIAVFGAVCSVLLIVTRSPTTDWRGLWRLNWRPACLLLALMSVYGVAFTYLGFGISTVLFLMIAFLILGERRMVPMLLVAVPLVAGFWLILKLLGIQLESGAWLMALAAGEFP